MQLLQLIRKDKVAEIGALFANYFGQYHRHTDQTRGEAIYALCCELIENTWPPSTPHPTLPATKHNALIPDDASLYLLRHFFVKKHSTQAVCHALHIAGNGAFAHRRNRAAALFAQALAQHQSQHLPIPPLPDEWLQRPALSTPRFVILSSSETSWDLNGCEKAWQSLSPAARYGLVWVGRITEGMLPDQLTQHLPTQDLLASSSLWLTELIYTGWVFQSEPNLAGYGYLSLRAGSDAFIKRLPHLVKVTSALFDFWHKGCWALGCKAWLNWFAADASILHDANVRNGMVYCAQHCLLQQLNAQALQFWKVTGDLYYTGYWHDYEQIENVCLSAAQLLGDTLTTAEIDAELGWLAMEQDRYETSECYLNHALKLFTQLNMPLHILRVRRYLATRLLYSQHYQQALDLFRQLFAELEQLKAIFIGDSDLLAALQRQSPVLHEGIGLCLMYLGDYAEAERYLEIARQTSDLFNNVSRPIMMNNLSELKFLQKQFAQAEEWAEQALNLSIEVNARQAAATSLLYMARAYHGLGNKTFAIRLAKQALRLFQAMNIPQRANTVQAFLDDQ